MWKLHPLPMQSTHVLIVQTHLPASASSCIRIGSQELVRSHEIDVDVATSFADFDAAVSGIDSEPAAEIPEWNRRVLLLLLLMPSPCRTPAFLTKGGAR